MTSPFRHRSRTARWLTALAATAASVLALLTVPSAQAGGPGGPGCQTDRRTVVSVAGKVKPAKGTWVPCVVDTGMQTVHSGLGIDSSGALLRSVAPAPTSIAVSTDEGGHWARRALPGGAAEGASDSYLDPATNRFYYYGMATDGKGPIYYTDDRGKTWHVGDLGPTTRFDWPRIWAGRPVTPRTQGWPTNVYYCNWEILLGEGGLVGCAKSTDGGTHFTTVSHLTLPTCALTKVGYLPGQALGRGIVDPKDGALYVPVHTCGDFYLYVSKDEGSTWSMHKVTGAQGTPLTAAAEALMVPAFRNDLLNGGHNIVSAEMVSSEIVDSLVMDRKGRLYFGWVDARDYLPYLAVSTDHGTTWGKVVRLSPPGVVTTAMLSLAMTKSGELGMSYYGTQDKETFTGYLGVVRKPAKAIPRIQTSTVTPPGKPLMNMPCCWGGSTQEYTSARWAPDGSLWAAFATADRATSGESQGVLGRLVPTRKAK